MKKTTKLLAWAVAVAIGGLAMTNIASAYSIEYHPEANVSYTLNWNENFTAGLITITDWTNTYTIMDRNLWATSTGIDSSDSYWYYFQWWNNYWFPTVWSVATSSTQVDASGYWPWNYYSSSTFITRSSSPWDRSSVQNDNLWWWVSGTYEAMQWPCPEWYHVPSSGEWLGLSTMLWYDGTFFSNASIQATNSLRNELYLPFAGYRYHSSAGVSGQGTDASYWSSTAYSADIAYYLSFYSAGLNPQLGGYRSDGFFVRCFKNSPYSASDLPSEGGDSEIIVNIAEFNWWQNTCTWSNFLFENIVAWTSTGTYTRSWVFECAFWNGKSSPIVTLQLSWNLVASWDRVISWSNLEMINSEWTVTPGWLKFAQTLSETYKALTATQELFHKSADLIWVASWVVTIKLTVPWWTPDGTYNWTLVLTY